MKMCLILTEKIRRQQNVLCFKEKLIIYAQWLKSLLFYTLKKKISNN